MKQVTKVKLDAMTAEPLHPTKYIEVFSPDRSLCLRYNTSSLLASAARRGAFFQPPHFEEPMDPKLILAIEKLEGKAFPQWRGPHFDAHVSAEEEKKQHGSSVGSTPSSSPLRHLDPSKIFDD